MREESKLTSSLLALLSSRWSIVCLVFLIIIVAVGAYLRLIPAIRYGLELDEADPFIMYYIAQHFHENGLLAFEELRKQDLFWYPYGRDLLRQEYIGVGWLSAATYPIVSSLTDLTLREWVALQPVVFYVLTTIALYMLVLRVTGSHSGALLSAVFYSTLPSALSRTTVGFVEKMTIAFLPMTLHYLLLYEALSSKSKVRLLLSSALAGLMGGSVALIWGGYHYIALSLTLIIMIDPIIYGSPARSRALAYIIILLFKALAISIAPTVSIKYFISGLGLAPLASLIIYLSILAWKELKLDEKIFPYTRLLHVWLIASGIVVGIVMIYLGVISVPGRILLALGIRGFSPLAESVSEHQPLELQLIAVELGLPLALGLAGFIPVLRSIYRGVGDTRSHLFIAIIMMTLLMTYASINMAYFLQTAVLYASLSGGFSLGVISSMYLSNLSVKTPKRGKSRGREASLVSDDLRIAIVIGLIGLLLLFTAYNVHASYEVNSLRAPQILTSGLGILTIEGRNIVPLNKAWQYALQYLRENTSPTDVIVSWWDYGYWISVDAGRKTLADGSTWNETHIRLLAKILTGTETEAVSLMKLLGLKPNQTYVVFYEVFVEYARQGDMYSIVTPIPNIQVAGNTFYVVYGAADFPKSFQMLKIAYRIDLNARTYLDSEYYTTTQLAGRTAYLFPGFIGGPSANAQRVSSTLIYKLAMAGIAMLPERCIGRCDFLANYTFVIPGVLDPTSMSIQIVPVSLPEKFSLEAVAVDVFHEVSRNEYIERYLVAVFIYKWVDYQNKLSITQ